MAEIRGQGRADGRGANSDERRAVAEIMPALGGGKSCGRDKCGDRVDGVRCAEGSGVRSEAVVIARESATAVTQIPDCCKDGVLNRGGKSSRRRVDEGVAPVHGKVLGLSCPVGAAEHVSDSIHQAVPQCGLAAE